MLSSRPNVVVLTADPDVIQLARDALASRFVLAVAHDAPAALALITRAPVAVAVLALDPPHGDALDTLAELWRAAPELRVVVCTAAQRALLDARFPDSDALLVLDPAHPGDLSRAVRVLAGSWEAQRGAAHRLAELERCVTAQPGELSELAARLADELAWRARVEADVRLSRRFETVGQLASGIAHEINNPIQYVGDNLLFLEEGATELLGAFATLQHQLDHHPDPDAVAGLRATFQAIDLPYLTREFPASVEMIQGGIARITTIVRAMKELSHPGSQEPRLADVNRALRSALELSAATYRAIADVDQALGELPLVTCFISELGQVFLNLIVNAAHAMEGGARGKLGVSTRADGDAVVIAISDSGSGIPEAIRDRIFDPYFTTKDVGRGTGQGLAIARSIIIDRHAGALTFESVVGQGTTFTIRIPIAGPGQQAAIAAA